MVPYVVMNLGQDFFDHIAYSFALLINAALKSNCTGVFGVARFWHKPNKYILSLFQKFRGSSECALVDVISVCSYTPEYHDD